MAPASTRHSATPTGIAITPMAKLVLCFAKVHPKTGTGSKIQSSKVRRMPSQQPENSIATSPSSPAAHGPSSMPLTSCSDAPEKPPPISGMPAAAPHGSIATLLILINDSGLLTNFDRFQKKRQTLSPAPSQP